MKPLKPISILLLILSAAFVQAADYADPAEQAEIVEYFEPKVNRFKAEFDEAGNVIELHLNNLGGPNQGMLSVNDEDMKRVARLPELRYLLLWHLKIGDEGFANLAPLKSLEEWESRDFYKYNPENVTPDYVLVLNQLPQIQRLDLMHMFGMDAVNLDGLGTFPQLVQFNIDTPATGEQVAAFAERNPTIQGLGLHRTDITPEQLARVVKALPNLDGLLIRYANRRDHENNWASLASLSGASNLEELHLGEGFTSPIPWEGGLENLVELDSLERIRFTRVREGLENEPAWQRLQQERPDIQLHESKFTYDP